MAVSHYAGGREWLEKLTTRRTGGCIFASILDDGVEDCGTREVELMALKNMAAAALASFDQIQDGLRNGDPVADRIARGTLREMVESADTYQLSLLMVGGKLLAEQLETISGG